MKILVDDFWNQVEQSSPETSAEVIDLLIAGRENYFIDALERLGYTVIFTSID